MYFPSSVGNHLIGDYLNDHSLNLNSYVLKEWVFMQAQLHMEVVVFNNLTVILYYSAPDIYNVVV